TYLGYAMAHYADFYEIRHVLILGRVTSGKGADIILKNAHEVLETEFPEISGKIQFHVPDEKEKRHDQAIAAASLPNLRKYNQPIPGFCSAVRAALQRWTAHSIRRLSKDCAAGDSSECSERPDLFAASG